MELTQVLRMNGGDGNTSYANNSFVQVPTLTSLHFTQFKNKIYIIQMLNQDFRIKYVFQIFYKVNFKPNSSSYNRFMRWGWFVLTARTRIDFKWVWYYTKKWILSLTQSHKTDWWDDVCTQLYTMKWLNLLSMLDL